MKIPLQEFEQLIDEKILKRGLSYFNGGVITDCEETSPGKYVATISGSEDYKVRLHLQEDVIIEHDCNCPFVMGPVCKHVVAVIFYMRNGILELDQQLSKAPKRKNIKSSAKQVKELLNVVSHDELKEFVHQNSKKDKKFKNYFLSSFGHLNQSNSKEYFQNQINSILESAAGRDGWISWSDMKYVVKATAPILDNAEQYLVNKKFESVFYISTAMLEEMTEALQFGDDSNGDIGYFIDSAFRLLLELIEEGLPNILKSEIFEYCISSFNNKLFDGWDWHLGMIEIACDLIEIDNDVDVVLKCLDNVKGDYLKQQAQSLKLDLLRRYRSKEEVEVFINKNISNHSIRSKEIEIAFENKNYERVVSLSIDGISSDKEDKPGLVKIWYNWLLKVAQAKKDNPKIIEYARFLFIDNFHPKQDYYQILKDTVEVENWHPFLEKIITEITPKGNWTYTELIRSIYINEEWWDRLFFMLRDNISLKNIEQNEKYLSNNFTPELIEMYSERIISYLDRHLGRKNYQNACMYLRRMKNLGGHDKVKELIELLKEKYPRRLALLDELKRV